MGLLILGAMSSQLEMYGGLALGLLYGYSFGKVLEVQDS